MDLNGPEEDLSVNDLEFTNNAGSPLLSLSSILDLIESPSNYKNSAAVSRQNTSSIESGGVPDTQSEFAILNGSSRFNQNALRKVLRGNIKLLLDSISTLLRSS